MTGSRFGEALFDRGIFGGQTAAVLDVRKLFTVPTETRTFTVPADTRVFTVTV